MGRLNDAIRVSVTFLNTIVFLVGLGAIAAGAYALSVTSTRFSTSTLTGWTSWIIIAGIIVALIGTIGCMGTFNQIQRKGGYVDNV